MHGVKEIANRAAPWSLFLERAKRTMRREPVQAFCLLMPGLLVIIVFVGWPFLLGCWLSLTDALVGQMGKFVGLRHYVEAWESQIFRETLYNTFVYTIWATSLKLAFGMYLALLLNHKFRGKRLVRATVLLPWIVPTVLSAIAWLWLFDTTFSAINWVLRNVFWAARGVNWLGAPRTAMISLIIVNIWRGMPFFAITLLAALQTINPRLYEAAEIDGAGGWAKFVNITFPLVLPVVSVVMLFSIIWTFADFQLIYVLTRGGPANSTHVLGTLAYQISLTTGRLGAGSSIALYMFPILLLVVVIILRRMKRYQL